MGRTAEICDGPINVNTGDDIFASDVLFLSQWTNNGFWMF